MAVDRPDVPISVASMVASLDGNDAHCYRPARIMKVKSFFQARSINRRVPFDQNDLGPKVISLKLFDENS
jgi:hypothetical protein